MNTKIVNTNPTKVCSKCQEKKPLNDFGKCKTFKDGLMYVCKSCVKEHNKQRYFLKNYDKIIPKQQQLELQKKENKKPCTKCKLKKDLIKFGKNKNHKDDLNSICKACTNQNSKQHYLNNRKEINLRHKQHNLEHKEEISLYHKQLYLDNKEEIDIKHKQHYLNNREEINLQRKQHRIEHKEEINLKNKIHRVKNRDKINLKAKQRRIDNNEEICAHRREYENNRFKTDISHRMLCNCRSRVRLALKGNWKTGHTIELLMCSIPELKAHLEKHFRIGMTWENYGYGEDKWNIDHIIPCIFFNMSDPVEQYMCFRWQNLQPLWQTDNFSKHDKI